MKKIYKLILSNSLGRYLLTGGSAFLLEYLLYLILTKLGVAYEIAASITFTIVFLLTFVISRKFTFRSNGKISLQFVAHLTLFIFNLVFGTYYLMQWIILLGCPPPLAPIIKMLLIASWNYLIFKWIIYKN